MVSHTKRQQQTLADDPAPTCSLQTAKKADPSYLERFAIFSREQQHTQKSAGSSGQATDLVSYVEFQRNYRLVMKVHKEALLSMRIFWMCLLQHQIKFDAMSAAVERMDTAIKAAERTYRWGHAYTCIAATCQLQANVYPDP
jgi:hypothetical protein